MVGAGVLMSIGMFFITRKLPTRVVPPVMDDDSDSDAATPFDPEAQPVVVPSSLVMYGIQASTLVMSVVWIYLLATELVGLLETIGARV